MQRFADLPARASRLKDLVLARKATLKAWKTISIPSVAFLIIYFFPDFVSL